MKFSRILLLIILLSNILLTGCQTEQDKQPLKADSFTNPPDSAKVHSWWHWMDGNVTREGITKDLEAMSKQGISQATLFNIGLFHERFFGQEQVVFNTPEWYDLFSYALKEAKRLDIKLGVHNCDGWSSSGGPWITPEHAMKQITWNKNHVEGGEKVRLQLPEPYSLRDYYREVAVLAVKSPGMANSFVRSTPEMLLNDTGKIEHLYDGCPVGGVNLKEGHTLTINFDKPHEAEKIIMHPRKRFSWGNMDSTAASFTLLAGDDSYRKVTELSFQGLNHTVTLNIPQTKARSYKIRVDNLSNMGAFLMGELELLKTGESPNYSEAIPGHQLKTSAVKGSKASEYAFSERENDAEPLEEEQIIDITSKVDEAGNLNWNAPEGNWNIIRFGYTITDAMNGPATEAGRGLECDKMDTTALNVHFRDFPQKLINHAGDHTGNTFKFLLVDSWECSFQNWTDGFADKFESLNGYPIKQWIPVLCGELVNNRKQSESFLHDFRNTIATMIEKNYYQHFSELCHKAGLELHGEVIYGGGGYPPLDILKSNSYLDMPMFEFWTSQNSDALISYNPSVHHQAHFASNAGLFYDKPVVGSEAYTGFAHYSESPRELKPFGDKAYTSGINQMILHSYVHQPFERKPGMTLSNFGLTFNRHNTYWDHTSGWLRYQTRIQYMLRNSTEASDVLCYVGDKLPQFYGGARQIGLPKGYSVNLCNYDILQNQLRIDDHKVRGEHGESFSLLVLPEQKGMNHATLLRLEEMIKQGAIVYGKPPEYPLSLSDEKSHKEEFNTLVQKIWSSDGNDNGNEAEYGKGKVLWGMSLGEALDRIDLKPDFSASAEEEKNFLYTHKQNGSTDIYFVVNQLNHPVEATCKFRTGGKAPEIWDPINGRVAVMSEYKSNENICTATYKFEPREAVFFVLRENQSNNDLKQLKTEPTKIHTIDKFQGTIEFDPAYEEDIQPEEVSQLKPLSAFEVKKIRYFAGKATYTINFKLPDDMDPSKQGWYLNLGQLDATAEVSLNDNQLGTVWSPQQELKVENDLKENNTLKVTVAIPYRNRFIGDFIQYGESEHIWTSANIGNFLNPETPLKEVGLMGPVEIRKYDQ